MSDYPPREVSKGTIRAGGVTPKTPPNRKAGGREKATQRPQLEIGRRVQIDGHPFIVDDIAERGFEEVRLVLTREIDPHETPCNWGEEHFFLPTTRGWLRCPNCDCYLLPGTSEPGQ